MKKPFLAILGLAGTVVLAMAFTKNDPGYKNLQILPKDISEHQLDSIMRHFNASLGVRCNFCHVRNAETGKSDFASDSNKHKGVAREMMTMTSSINKKYFEFDGKITINSKLMVSCYTCHHGKAEPETAAPQGPPRERPQGPQAWPPPQRLDSTKTTNQ
jgi:hypothetical protein